MQEAEGDYRVTLSCDMFSERSSQGGMTEASRVSWEASQRRKPGMSAEPHSMQSWAEQALGEQREVVWWLLCSSATAVSGDLAGPGLRALEAWQATWS